MASHPEEEIDRVTTPQKVVQLEGLNEMEHKGLSSSLIQGMVASFQSKLMSIKKEQIMSLFNVYPLFNITPVKGKDVYMFMIEDGTMFNI